MAHTLTIVEPIWPMLQKLSKTLVGREYKVCNSVEMASLYLSSLDHSNWDTKFNLPLNNYLITIQYTLYTLHILKSIMNIIIGLWLHNHT